MGWPERKLERRLSSQRSFFFFLARYRIQIATSAAAFKYFSLSREIGMIGGGWLRARQ